jgi:hypothetical protein
MRVSLRAARSTTEPAPAAPAIAPTLRAPLRAPERETLLTRNKSARAMIFLDPP